VFLGTSITIRARSQSLCCSTRATSKSNAPIRYFSFQSHISNWRSY